jgi:hypothetical protein
MFRSAFSLSPQRLRVLQQLAGGVVVCSIPVAVWYQSARNHRTHTLEQHRTRVKLPSNIQDTLDLLIQNKMQAGDVLLFDRTCHRCAAGPWAALACLMAKTFLCDDQAMNRSVEHGKYDHVGESENDRDETA